MGSDAPGVLVAPQPFTWQERANLTSRIWEGFGMTLDEFLGTDAVAADQQTVIPRHPYGGFIR